MSHLNVGSIGQETILISFVALTCLGFVLVITVSFVHLDVIAMHASNVLIISFYRVQALEGVEGMLELGRLAMAESNVLSLINSWICIL